MRALMQRWVQAAPTSARALALLGQIGRSTHAGVIAQQLNGGLGEAAKAALKQLRARFPDAQGGQLTLLADEAGGGLALTATDAADEA